MKNVAVPVTGPLLPLNVAVSLTVSPKSADDFWEVVAIVGGTHVLRLPKAKSFSWASVSAEVRVSARNEPKHGAWPSNMSERLMPPSKNWPAAKSWAPSLFVKVHGAVAVAALTTAQMSNVPSATSHSAPAATRSRLLPLAAGSQEPLLARFPPPPAESHS